MTRSAAPSPTPTPPTSTSSTPPSNPKDPRQPAVIPAATRHLHHHRHQHRTRRPGQRHRRPAHPPCDDTIGDLAVGPPHLCLHPHRGDRRLHQHATVTGIDPLGGASPTPTPPTSPSSLPTIEIQKTPDNQICDTGATPPSPSPSPTPDAVALTNVTEPTAGPRLRRHRSATSPPAPPPPMPARSPT